MSLDLGCIRKTAGTALGGLLIRYAFSVVLYFNTTGRERFMNIIRVAASSRSTSVAGAIAGVIREQGHVDVQAIGASAVNQAVKAVAIARGYLELDQIDVVCLPSFSEVIIEGKERTAVRLGVVNIDQLDGYVER
jgi:stage V sporulation protein S